MSDQLPTPEAAAFLGITELAVRSLVYRGSLSCTHVGRSLRFDVSALAAYRDARNAPHGPLPSIEEMWADVRARLVPNENGCWIWPGAVQRGYGAVRRRGTVFRTHRIAYEATHGPIPGDLCVDHMCHNPHTCPGGQTCPHRRCNNPDHLRLLTREENSALASPKYKAICVNGHVRAETIRINKNGRRVCVECVRLWRRRKAA